MPALNGNRVKLQDSVRNQLHNLKKHKRIPQKRKRLDLGNPKNAREARMTSLVLRKKKFLSAFKALKPRTLTKVPSDGSGINFRYAFKIGGRPVEITLDLKTSFGNTFGHDKLAARVSPNRRLINSAGWALVITRTGTLEAFEMQHLHNFIKSNWGSIPKKDAIKKENYTVYPVDMKAFYSSQGIKPITGRLEAGSIQKVLKQIRDVYIKEHPVVKKQEKTMARAAPMITPVNGKRNLSTSPKKLPPQNFTKKNVIRQTRGVRKQPRGR